MKDNKYLLVTGASSDIGIELIKRIKDNYSKIIFHYNNSEELMKKLVNLIGDKIVPVHADFSDKKSIEKMITEMCQGDLIPDHIVHLAALKFHVKKFTKENIDDIRREFITTVESITQIIQAFIPNMCKQKNGKILFMLSKNTIGYPAKYQTSYTMSKYALLGLMHCIAVEYAEKGITCNAISPDMIETKFISDIPDMIIQQNGEDCPQKRNLQCNDVIATFEYLLSEGADMVTGANIPITGGHY